MGHGSVSQRPNGLWQAQVAVEGRRRTVYARSQAECVAKLHQLQQQISGGLPAVGQRRTVSRYLDAWLESVASRVRPRSMRHYTYIARLISGEVGRVMVAKLQPGDVGRMLARLQASVLSPQTCAHVRAVLRTALADAERDGLVSRNVARLSDAPRVPGEARTLDPLLNPFTVLSTPPLAESVIEPRCETPAQAPNHPGAGARSGHTEPAAGPGEAVADPDPAEASE
jgi:hypothetical protein